MLGKTRQHGNIGAFSTIYLRVCMLPTRATPRQHGNTGRGQRLDLDRTPPAPTIRSTPELRHIQTPPHERGALWWLVEHHAAEKAVTLAGMALDAARDEYQRRLFSKLLDVRLDHLEAVDSKCDELLERLRAESTALADACAAHYIHGKTWQECAGGKRAQTLYGSVIRAINHLDNCKP